MTKNVHAAATWESLWVDLNETVTEAATKAAHAPPPAPVAPAPVAPPVSVTPPVPEPVAEVQPFGEPIELEADDDGPETADASDDGEEGVAEGGDTPATGESPQKRRRRRGGRGRRKKNKPGEAATDTASVVPAARVAVSAPVVDEDEEAEIVAKVRREQFADTNTADDETEDEQEDAQPIYGATVAGFDDDGDDNAADANLQAEIEAMNKANIPSWQDLIDSLHRPER